MEPKLIDLKEWILSGGGAQGRGYVHKKDRSKMLKLYNLDFDADYVKEELEISRKVEALGVPTPAAGEIVTDGIHIGVIYHRI